MGKLTSARVREILKDCLYRDEELTNLDPKSVEELPTGAVMVEGIMSKFAFHPERVAKHKAEIIELLCELPDNFHVGKGGGWSFLNACVDKHGEQWGEHPSMDELFTLGKAIGAVKDCLPREMWAVFPGGMPYLMIDTTPATETASAG